MRPCDFLWFLVQVCERDLVNLVNLVNVQSAPSLAVTDRVYRWVFGLAQPRGFTGFDLDSKNSDVWRRHLDMTLTWTSNQKIPRWWASMESQGN